MDAVNFVEERTRMCNSFNSLECKGCPAFNAYEISCAVSQESTMSATDQIDIVEKWSTAHPHKTRQDVFLDQWPEAQVGDDGFLKLCPSTISSAHRNKYGGCANYGANYGVNCSDCCRKFWMQKVD